jgi:hypothetical protein
VDRHVSLLGVLARVWGALAALVGVSLLLLAAGALAELLDPVGPVSELAAGVAAAAFAVGGLFALAWGGVHLWAAARLVEFRPSGRIAMLALAVVNLLVFPPGTALGMYALWVLLSPDLQRRFTAARTR